MKHWCLNIISASAFKEERCKRGDVVKFVMLELDDIGFLHSQEYEEFFRVIPNMSVGAAKEVQYMIEVLGEAVLKSSPIVLRFKATGVKDTKAFKAFVEEIGQAPQVRNEISL